MPVVSLPGGRTIPLKQFATFDYGQDFPLVWRRNRVPTLTLQADVADGVLPAAAEYVDRRKEGTNTWYRITDPQVFKLCELVCGTLEQELDAFLRDWEPTTPGIDSSNDLMKSGLSKDPEDSFGWLESSIARRSSSSSSEPSSSEPSSSAPSASAEG